MLLRRLQRAHPFLLPSSSRRPRPLRHCSTQTPPISETTNPRAAPHPTSAHLPTPPPPVPVPVPIPVPRPSSSNLPLYLISGTVICSLSLASFLYSASSEEQLRRRTDELRRDLGRAMESSAESLGRVAGRLKQTGAAAAVLWKSLASVLSSANQEVQKEFELRVAAFVADIVAVNEGRRSAIVSAGGGAVVDWLLETVARPSGRNGRDHGGTQAESARALAYLISDPNVCEAVLGRPHAIPNLLRFIFSFQPKRAKKKFKQGPLDGQDTFKGRSMLVAAIMDIITSNCENVDRAFFQPSLPGNADVRDIAAALEVIEEGSMHFDEYHRNEDDDEDNDGDKGMRGIGIKILGGATVLGFSRDDELLELAYSDDGHTASVKHIPDNMMRQERHAGSLKHRGMTSLSVPGLWDDLQRDHVAVPFAAWALAHWAMASKRNRSYIQELDSDGHAVMTALNAPERTVKWHGSLIARVLLEDRNLPLTGSVPDWTFSLLSTLYKASKAEDVALAGVALSAFLVSIERSDQAKTMVMEKGLHLMRQTAKQAEKHRHLQEALARAMELLYTGEMHLSLEESQRWSGILLRWIFAEISSEDTRLSAKKILSYILEDCGPASIPISQGWLTIMLNEVLGANKTSVLRGTAPQKTDKVKTQIDESNILSAAQIATLLAGTVVNLAFNQGDGCSDSSERFPLADFLSLEPFANVAKNLRKDKLPKINAADSAFATLKGIKALTELCSDDSTFQGQIADFGVLCLLKRFILQDDYERLAAIEAYDASRSMESRGRGSNTAGEASSLDTNDSSTVRVPPTAHIRKHSARLLMILSLLPKVKKAIIADKILCKWLEDCANGRIPGCNDLKIQSYARATLLNAFCLEQTNGDAKDSHPGTQSKGQTSKCPRYDDMIFLMNPDLPHWKYFGQDNLDAGLNDSCDEKGSNDDSFSSHDNGLHENNNNSPSDSINDSDRNSELAVPIMDVVFIHGLRGGPFKSWRISDNKSSTTSRAGLVEKIDQEAGKQGTCWPKEWLAADFPNARLFTVKYKTNLTQWSGASLPLQEVSSKLLAKLVAAGIGNRPVVFVTHSMGGLVVKQMLYHAKINDLRQFVDNTIGVVFYSCPHFGSKLADMPWRMGLVFRPAPTIGELRSGSQRLLELNDFIRQRFNKGLLDVLSFSETLVTPIVEGYGGWAFRMEVVPIESAYPGFGDIIVLDATDHINSCKPVNRTDPSYAKTLEFLQKLTASNE
uniref:Protein SERAC1 n=1 Tax=Anthurium amnicola TaxID=1678845 RepID=A0A1D1ZJ94_9ARAE